jgi:predicted secreted Zn-dependent protease
MIMRKVLFVALVVPLFACQFLQPTPLALSTPPNESRDPIQIEIENATMIYYTITGSTANELRQEMSKLGTLDPDDGLRYDARTDWYISWNWPGYGESECDLSQTSINYDIKVTVPFWKPSSDIDPALVNRWNHYMNNLAMHEQGHVNIILNHYLKVRDAIQAATCDTAEEVAQEAANELRVLNQEYDKQTGHGETQGAVFP